MALQGLDYRPRAYQKKIFEKGDMQDYFKQTKNQWEVSSANAGPFLATDNTSQCAILSGTVGYGHSAILSAKTSLDPLEEPIISF